jgi:hypothetical protein
VSAEREIRDPLEGREPFWVRAHDKALRTLVGVVYFVSAGDDGPIKVGFTTGKLARRLADLQLSSPVRLRVVWAIRGGRAKEREVHLKLAAHRLHGEWFARDAVLDYLKPIVQPHEGLRLVKGGKR